MLRPPPPLTWGANWVLLVGSVWNPRLTPGTRPARLPIWRPFSGRFSIWLPVMISPTPVSFWSMSGASARTVSSSDWPATAILNSTVVVAATFTVTLFRLWPAKPLRSALTS